MKISKGPFFRERNGRANSGAKAFPNRGANGHIRHHRLRTFFRHMLVSRPCASRTYGLFRRLARQKGSYPLFSVMVAISANISTTKGRKGTGRQGRKDTTRLSRGVRNSPIYLYMGGGASSCENYTKSSRARRRVSTYDCFSLQYSYIFTTNVTSGFKGKYLSKKNDRNRARYGGKYGRLVSSRHFYAGYLYRRCPVRRTSSATNGAKDHRRGNTNGREVF